MFKNATLKIEVVLRKSGLSNLTILVSRLFIYFETDLNFLLELLISQSTKADLSMNPALRFQLEICHHSVERFKNHDIDSTMNNLR